MKKIILSTLFAFIATTTSAFVTFKNDTLEDLWVLVRAPGCPEYRFEISKNGQTRLENKYICHMNTILLNNKKPIDTNNYPIVISLYGQNLTVNPSDFITIIIKKDIKGRYIVSFDNR